ncbi:MAG: hypothetical protein HPY50_10945 [Firmicutes bacterium]|nr:hypothetical protein [Bacillota bacterium]
MSILNLGRTRKRLKKFFLPMMALTAAVVMLAAAFFPGTALAGNIGDVVTEVAKANYSSPEFDFGSEDATGLNIKLHAGYGNLSKGYGGVSVLGPTDAAGMKAMLQYIDGEANHTSIQTTRMKGCEVREYTMSDGTGVGVILPDYFITVETYKSGNSQAVDFQNAKRIAQQVLDGLERNGLLSQAAPDIEAADPAKKEQSDKPAAAATGKPLDEPVKIADTMNIYGVSSGPTAPTTFSVSSPHLVTFITTYHWNSARGAPGGTIALKGGDGKVYGPWKVSTRPGQGGVPNAYWEVFPNIVVPAGTYTIIDSDPTTWSQNQQSGGRGMGEVKATPHFEAAGGSSGGTGKRTSDGSAAGSGWAASPAGVGSVGSIPGPSNTTEAVVGVAVPGLIATGLGALAGLGGGGGGFAPSGGIPFSPTGGGPYPGAGGGGAQHSAAIQEVGQPGRRRDEPAPIPGIIVDTAEMGQGAIGAPSGDGLIVDTAHEAAVFVRPEPGIIIDTADEAAILIKPDSKTVTDGAGGGIVIDTSALDDRGEAGAEAQTKGVIEESGYDREGYNSEGFDKAGFDKEGFDKAGFNKEGFDKAGFDKAGFDKAGFNKEGFDKAGFDKAGFDKAGFNKEGFDKTGFDKEGFDKAGFNKAGFNKEGFDKTGFDKEGFDKTGFNKEGFDKTGFNKEGFDKTGFNKEGFDKTGFNKEGFDKAGFNKEGFDKAGFNKEGFDKEGFDKSGFNKEGFDKAGFNKEGFDKTGFNKEGFDKAGFNKEGFDKAGFDKEGFDKSGFDKEGFDKAGFDKEGFNKEGLKKEDAEKAAPDKEEPGKAGSGKKAADKAEVDKEGPAKDGYDKDGYDKDGYDRDGRDEYGFGKDGFNENGVDKDGYDREGFDYEGYSCGGYDPWGYDKQGYDKDGYHWSGYNADGYNRSGRHWTENPYEKGSPFDVITGSSSPFAEDRDVIASVSVELDENGRIIGGKNLADSWKPEKPPLGEPYPKTIEKYGAKPWTDEIPQIGAEKPPVSKPDDTGVIGPEDPMNTLEKHGLGGEKAPTEAAQPQGEVPAAGKEDLPTPVSKPEDTGVIGPEDPMNTLNQHELGGKTVDTPAVSDETPSDYGEPPAAAGPSSDGLPQHGEKRILTGKTDGRSMEIEYNAKTGEWINTESGGIVDPDRFEQWQEDLAEDWSRSAEDLEKMGSRQDAHSKAIDQNLDDWQKLEQMQKAAEKHGIGEPGGPGDVDKAIQKLKDDMLAGKELDRDKMEQINKIIDDRITGATAADTGDRWEEVPWYKDLDSALKANLETAKELVTGEKDDGSISWLGMGARAAIGAATGGTSEYVMTVAEAMSRIKDSVDKGESDIRAVAKAIGQLILEEAGGELIGAAGGKAMKGFADTFPNFTQKAGDVAEKIGLAVAAGDLIASSKLGLISKQSAEEALSNLAKQMDDIGAGGLRKVFDDKVAEAGLKVASADDLAKAFGKGTAEGADDLGKAVGKAAAGSGDEIAGGAGRAADGPDLPAQKGAGAADEAAEAAGKTAPVDRPASGARTEAEVLNDPRAVAKAEKSLQENMDGFDKMPDAKKQELIKEQAVYDEYQLQAEEKNWELADKVQRGEKLSVEDVLKMKSDPAAMRKLKEIQEIDGLGAELGDRGAKDLQIKYNETLNKNVYEPSYKDVRDALKDKYGEVRVDTIRTPGKEYHPWDINTDNDIIAQYKVVRNGKEEWVEIPRGEWEDTYFKSYAQNSGFDPQDAAKKFPDEDWRKMSQAEQYRKWGELHGESPTDVYHPEGARDFSTQRTSMLDGQAPDKAAAAQAARGKGALLDSEGLGLMEKNKINHYWEKGDIKSQTEAMEQLRKASSQAQNLEQGYKNMGYKIADMPANMKEGIKAVNDNSLSPAVRAARLAELGYDSPGDFVDKLTSRIGALRAAQK